MANAFDSYLRAKQSAMQQGQQQMVMEQTFQKMQREKDLQGILANAYQQPQEAIPAQAAVPEMAAAPAMGAMQPNAAPLADYPAQEGFEAQPAQAATAGGLNMRDALNAMYQGGFGKEALALEGKQASLAGTTPSMVNEYKFWSQLPAKDQERYLAVKRAQQIKKIGGVETVVSPLSGTTPLGDLGQEVSAKRELKKGEVLGGASAKLSSKAAESAEKIQGNITNLKEVVRLVDVEGAETGPLASKLPSFRASTVQLNNMRNRLGLDVIGAVTFGALSKGELDLAMDTALPTQLDGPELVQWAKDKISAQEKLMAYFQKQAIYLSKQGNTPASWTESQMKRPNQNKAALKWASENPNDPRAMRIMQKLQGAR